MKYLALQLAAFCIVLALALPYYGFSVETLSWEFLIWFVAATATLLSILCGQGWWWWIIQFCFAPLAYFLLRLQIPPIIFLILFCTLWLVYRGAISNRVPLFFSNAETMQYLADFLEEQIKILKTQNNLKTITFLDLGAGIGSSLIPLAKAFPQIQFVGVENAPLTWLVGKIRCKSCRNIRFLYKNFHEISLKDFDIVYAFLSPEPMPMLWEKVQNEMHKNSLFISNTFEIPNVNPSQILIDENNTNVRKILVYKI